MDQTVVEMRGPSPLKEGELSSRELRQSIEALQRLAHNVVLALMQQATEHHRQGRLAQARQVYHTVLQEQPRHADANHNLGVIELGAANFELAQSHFKTALDAQPMNWQYWISYADAFVVAGEYWPAAQVLEDARSAGLEPAAIDEMLERLVAESAAAASREPGAEHVLPEGAPEPSDVVALTTLLNQKRFAELEHASEVLTGRCPHNPFAWRMLALALSAQGRSGDCARPLREVALLCPQDAENFNALGMALIDRARLVEAEFAFRRAVGLAPQQTGVLSNLGMTLQRRGRLEQAQSWLERCITLDPDFHVAHLNLSVVLDELGKPEPAERSVRRALEIHPGFAQAHVSLGYLLKDQGRIVEAEGSTRRALELDPQNVAAHSNLLFVLNYHPDKSAEEIFQAYRAFDAHFGLPLRSTWLPHGNSRSAARRLRLGYVCPAFSQHSTRHFLEPLLAHHDHARFELVAYPEMAAAHDAATLRYQSYFDRWVPTAGLSDEALAQRIRDDGIDVLVDIAGHTRGNRLGVFARKPAPVSLHWLDFGYTTGLSAIDHYLTDRATAPVGSEQLFAETPWRLSVPALVYRPGSDMGEVSPLPALERGHVTFGTLTRAVRINHHTIRVWSEILRRVDGARLVIDSGNFKDAGAAESLRQRFVAQGIARDRLEIGCHSPPWDVLRGLDIGLDCFPHNSGTTLFEMLFMGVPYVTLAGRPSVGRLGGAILEGIGRPEWIASSEQQYVEAAVALAHDLPRLQLERERLRGVMQRSPLMDETGFARHVEAAFVQMFQRWAEQAGGATPDGGASPNPVDAQPSLEQMLQRAAQSSMELALAQHRAGRLDGARQTYLAILDNWPEHADANHNLAVILLEGGDARASLPYYRAACHAQPGNWQYWLSYFDALLQAGEHHAATDWLEQRRRRGLAVPVMTELVERLVECRLAPEPDPLEPGREKKGGGRHGAAKRRHKAAPEHRPAQHQVARVEALFAQGRMAEVAALAALMTERHPRAAFGWKALGAALVNLGQFEQALHPLQQAVDCSPRDPGSLSNLGFALQNQRRPVAAEVNLRLALRYDPRFASAVINLGAAVLSQDRYEEAATLYEQGLAIEPTYIPAHSHLAQVRDEQGRLVEAAAGFRRTLELLSATTIDLKAARYDVTQAHAHQGLSSVCAKLADYESVVAESDAALAIQPDDAVIWEKHLYALSYHPDLPVQDIFAEFVRWGNRFAPPAADFSTHDRTPARRIKVGYVSPDFRQHTSRFYFMPLFANHDHSVVEIHAYSNVKVEDEFTAKFKTMFDHWHDIRNLADDEVAAMVRADGIDILVDGCNHMRDDRLGVFALKPAPLQVTWLGAAWTTGLEAVDYVLFDPYLAPPQTLAREKIVRLPHCFVPFQAMVEADRPAPPPCLKNGYVTFAYSGRTERLNHHTFRVWGEILRRVPDARLVLDYRHFDDARNQAHFSSLMARHGLDPQRVEMRNSSNIFQGLHDFDILLDCFPHSGGTMLVDALWMGVPALTLASRPPLGRIGTTFMTNIGLPQWVAHSEQEYIEKACAFASDRRALADLRAGMRERMSRSRLMDGPGFARAVESAYRAMWARYCAGEAPAAFDVAAPTGVPA